MDISVSKVPNKMNANWWSVHAKCESDMRVADSLAVRLLIARGSSCRAHAQCHALPRLSVEGMIV